MATHTVRYPLLILAVVVMALLAAAAVGRLHIDTDVAAGLPHDDGVLEDAVHIFKNHPIQNQIAIDVGLEPAGAQNKDLLVKAANEVEEQLGDSGLFKRVGMEEIQKVIPGLIGHVVHHLPYLFSEKELQDQIGPLLEPEAIDAKFKALHQSLIGFDAIGQADLMVRDPLGFRDSKLKALAALAPAQNVQIYKGKLLSADSRHVMIVAQPAGSGTDTAYARRLTETLRRVDDSVQKLYAGSDHRVTITPVGAYRAALDNETMVRRDVNQAILLATLGIAVLLLLAFPRPLIGLLALLPALAGTTASLFVFSLFNESISIMALGFGGGVISITVDHGIAYLLFIDRPEGSSGKTASREVWSVGLLAVLTTIGAFLVLTFSGFLIFKQLGLFTAMGIAFSFLFVHWVFPHIFPQMPPARKIRSKPLQRWADGLARLGTPGLLAAALAAGLLFFWAKPHFNVNLSTMNSVSQETRDAETLFSKVWGDVFSNIYLMSEAPTLEALQEKGDHLLDAIEGAKSKGVISSAFATADLYPGSRRRQANFEAWRAFWSPVKVDRLQSSIARSALDHGFTVEAFEPFFQMVASPAPLTEMGINPRYFEVLGISRSETNGTWRQITSMAVGPAYDGQGFYDRFSPLAKVFDAQLFSDKMGQLLFDTFGEMLLTIGASVVVLLFIFFADWRLTLISLLPMIFAFVCTLGSLRLMGRNLDIPVLMLAIIVLGLGIDYSLFFVRAYQRYQKGDHPSFSLIRMSVLMASLSTLIGFGVLCRAEHTLLQSAGLSSMLGIGYSMLGAFLILPPLLKRRFAPLPPDNHNAPDLDAAILSRYRNLEPYPRFFARFKLKTDVMFKELGDLLPPAPHTMGTIVDIGTGYGVPACWLLQRYPRARIFGIEPESDCVRVANLALGQRGKVEEGLAPRVPHPPDAADAAFMLDMCHFLSDEEFQKTLTRLHQKLKTGGHFFLRAVLEPEPPLSLTWRLDLLRMKLKGATPYHRSLPTVVDTVKDHGFDILKTQYSGDQKDMAWIVARKPEESP